MICKGEKMVEPRGIEPLTSAMPLQRLLRKPAEIRHFRVPDFRTCRERNGNRAQVYRTFTAPLFDMGAGL